MQSLVVFSPSRCAVTMKLSLFDCVCIGTIRSIKAQFSFSQDLRLCEKYSFVSMIFDSVLQRLCHRTTAIHTYKFRTVPQHVRREIFLFYSVLRLSVVNVGNNDDDAAAADYVEVDAVGVSTKNMASTLHIYAQIVTLTIPFIHS